MVTMKLATYYQTQSVQPAFHKPWTMASFDDVRNIVIQTVPFVVSLRCYVSSQDNTQTEWVLSDLGCLSQGSNKEKQRTLLLKWIGDAEKLHETIWPNEAVPQRRVAKKDRKTSSSLTQEESHFLLDERTIPTSILMCLLVQLSSDQKRQVGQRKVAFEWLRKLGDIAFQASSSFPVIANALHVDSNGFLMEFPWPNDLSDSIHGTWDMELLNAEAYFVQSTFSKPHSVDVIAFILRPVKVRPRSEYKKWSYEILPQLEPLLHSLVRAITDAFHQNIRLVSVSQGVKRKAAFEQGGSHGVHQKASIRTPLERTNNVASIIEQLYSREASRHAQQT